MKITSRDFILTILMLLLQLYLRCDALAISVYNNVNDNAQVCHDGFMSVYLSKAHFIDLPFTIYVQDEHGRYYQAVTVAKHCHYYLGESGTSVVLTVASNGCFVRRLKHMTNLTVVIIKLTERGRVEVVKSIPLICERKEGSKNNYPLVSRPLSCTKEGFNITISRHAAVPPLNLDTVWIPSGQGHCEPKNSFKDAVIFSFPFTDCGTQSMIADGIITYWVKVEAKHPQKGSVFHDPPFHFALAKMTNLSMEVQGEKTLSTLKGEGLLRTEMRFAKDSSYRVFFSTHEPPTMTELGQPVYVEVFVVKHQNEDLMLLLQDCWATPNNNPNDLQRWNLLIRGCPFSGDPHRTVVLPIVSSKELKYPSLHKWFVVKLFSFVKPQTFENMVYFHCDIKICKRSHCFQPCSNGTRKLKRIPQAQGKTILYSVVSGGPVLYL